VFEFSSLVVLRCGFGFLWRRKLDIVERLKFFLVKITRCKGEVYVVYIWCLFS